MMNKNLQRLYAIAQKPTRHIIGLMSGTSMDGLDVALCTLSGSGTATQVKIEQFTTVDYTDDIKAEIRQVFAKSIIDFQRLALLNSWIGNLHADMILSCLQKWGVPVETVDLVASHGQTVMHAPKRLHAHDKFSNATLQIGDGDHIAVKTGIITLSDFRQKHIAAGGEGAPLAVYGDYYIFSSRNENRIMLNMGGIANFTFLPANHDPNIVFVTDTGTGNTLIDALTRQYFPERAYDKDAAIARKGTVNDQLLVALKNHPFFAQPFPKTTGPELFNTDYVGSAQRASHTNDLNPADVIATLTRFSADTIADAIEQCSVQSGIAVEEFHIYMSGGGMHNPLLTGWIKDRLPCTFLPTDALGISGDAKEAVLFAILANETICGNANFGTRKDVPSVSMGKISFPS
jgi:anhydro-N-acetylmuramic acid kinase